MVFVWFDLTILFYYFVLQLLCCWLIARKSILHVKYTTSSVSLSFESFVQLPPVSVEKDFCIEHRSLFVVSELILLMAH